MSVQIVLVWSRVPSVAMNATVNVSAVCRDRFATVDVDTFRQRSCTLCFFYLFKDAGGLAPSRGNYTHLVRLNGSEVVERHVVDGEDPASLDRVCRRLADDMGGVDGCRRWTQCCTTADACCQRQRRRADAAGTHQLTVAPASCEATWDGFSCWDRTPAGSVVHQQCPVYMYRFDVNGL